MATVERLLPSTMVELVVTEADSIGNVNGNCCFCRCRLVAQISSSRWGHDSETGPYQQQQIGNFDLHVSGPPVLFKMLSGSNQRRERLPSRSLKGGGYWRPGG